MSGITLTVGQVLREDVPLAVGQVADSVDVSFTEASIQTDTSSNGTLIDNKQVVELPLASRQFYNLALLSPAAFQPAQNSTLGFRGGINIAGATEISNQFTVNGIYNNDMGVAQPSFRPSVEVIQEFRLLTGVYPAQYGRMSGGQVVIITKSGTNHFHGSAYEFLRNEFTDAKPYFTQAGARTPSFKQNTFGATVGGPIWKDHTFFFFGYEGQRIRRAVTATATVPTPDMLKGIINIGKTLYDPTTGRPMTPVTPGTTSYNLATAMSGTGAGQFGSQGAMAAQQIVQLGFPTPTIATAAGAAPGNNYIFQETRVENMNEFSVRIDHNLSAKDSLNGSFNLFKDPAFEPSNSLCSSYVLPKFGCFTNQISTLISLDYDRNLSANLVNSLRLGYQRLQQPRVQEDNTAIGPQFTGLPGGPYFNQPGYANNLGLPNTSISGYSTIGGATNLPQNRFDNHYQIVDTLTWAKGAHTFSFGVDALLASSTNVITSSGRGAFTVNDSNLATANSKQGGHVGYTGDSFADFLLGLTYSSTVGTTAGTVYLNFRGEDAFIQDDWKIRPYLTLNLGLRYELDEPVYSPHYTVSNFDLASQTFIAAGPKTFNHLYNYDRNNFAPRLGFSWQPTHADSTVVKGAVGVFYNQPLLYNQFLTNGTQYPFRLVTTYTSSASVAPSSMNSTGTINTITLNTPFQQAGVLLSPCTGAILSGCAASLSPLSISRTYRTPYLSEWSFGIEQTLSKTLLFETTYFGSKGTKLPLSVSLNVINPASAPATLNQGARPYPAYSTVTNQDTRGNSEFHSWQNSLKQSYHNGVTFMMAYTFSKSIDGGNGIGSGSNSSGTPQNPYNLRAERGLSDFDVRHRFVFSPVAELPFGKGKPYLNSGWESHALGGLQLSGIFSFQTGRPFTITNSNSNASGLYGNNDRPNLIGDPNAGPHTVKQWFNTAAFTSNTLRQFGTAGRNIVSGPGYTDLDLTLAKNFNIWEGVGGQFRVESFNLFNHPNFFNPYSTATQFGTTSFGSITTANDNRELQFSLRILY